MITEEIYLLAKTIVEEYESQQLNKYGVIKSGCDHNWRRNPDEFKQQYCDRCYSIRENKHPVL